MSFFRPDTFRSTDFRPTDRGTGIFRPSTGDVLVSVAEALGLAEAITFVDTTSIAETLGLAESITANVDFNVAVAESISLSEAIIFTVIGAGGGPGGPPNTVCDNPYWPDRSFGI